MLNDSGGKPLRLSKGAMCYIEAPTNRTKSSLMRKTNWDADQSRKNPISEELFEAFYLRTVNPSDGRN
jgi:hypothetical protein